MPRLLASARTVASAVLILLCWGTSKGQCQTVRGADAEGQEFFEKTIRPLLAERCYKCHGSKGKAKGGLRLDSREAMLAGGDSGPAIVPGNSESSRLIRAVRYSDPDLKMPPKKRLSPDEVAALEAWIKRGAPAPAHNEAVNLPAPSADAWAYRAPREPALPQVEDASSFPNPIDRFLRAELGKKHLRPVGPADKRTLIRRASYDLTGLPPSPEEVEAFLADNSPNAFAKVVDRLLASPAYGERWARHWLDLVRYTDDLPEAWRYRDWVVDSFNRDLPYDQFVTLQIAGDLLPPPKEGGVNADGIVATTMLSLGPWGGIDRKKRMADIVDDQIDMVGRTFLGLTLACARCHDHKFDPISTADYYGLAGIFYSTRVISDAVYLSHKTDRLQIPLVPPNEVEKHHQHMAKVRVLEKKLEAAVDSAYSRFARSLLPQTADYLIAAWEHQHRPSDQANVAVEQFATARKLQPFALQQWIDYLGGPSLAEFHRLDHRVTNYDGEAGVQAWGAHAERPWWAVNTNRHEVPIETWLLPPRSVAVNPGVEGGAVGWKSPITGKVRIRGRLNDADPHDGSGVDWAIEHVSGTNHQELSSGHIPNGGTRRLNEGRTPQRLDSVDVRAGDVIYLEVWLHEGDAHYDITNVELTISRLDGGTAFPGRPDGLGRPSHNIPGEWDLTRDALAHFLEGNPHGDSLGNACVWHYEDMAGSNRRQRMPAVEAVLKPYQDAIAKASDGKADLASVQKAARLVQKAIEKGSTGIIPDLVGPRSPFWVRNRDDAKYLSAQVKAELDKLNGEVEALRQSAPPLPVANGAQEGGPRFSLFPGIGDVAIHLRGNYERLGKKVPRHFPQALAAESQPTIRSGSGRLELARWIASPENPLTARVMVNRIWQHHFGAGLVRTPSNFGKLGEPATHPELLDWLARRFIASSWSIKAMHRQIMLSAAYQQSSRPSAELLRADPENRLFGRMNRQRLEAESLRDSLLAVCGRLDGRRGGPADDANSSRRMIYLKGSRSDRSGFGAVFDAANASMHVEKRTASTTSPQALALMNGPEILDGLHQLVNQPDVGGTAFPGRPDGLGRPSHIGGKTEARIQALYRRIFARRATANEVEIGRQFLESMADEKSPQPKDGTPPRLTSWESYAQTLLLSNEFVFVD